MYFRDIRNSILQSVVRLIINDINAYNFENTDIFHCGFYTKVTSAFLLQKNTWKLTELTFNVKKQKYHQYN